MATTNIGTKKGGSPQSYIRFESTPSRSKPFTLQVRAAGEESHEDVAPQRDDTDPLLPAAMNTYIQIKVNESPRGANVQVSKLFWNQDETAAKLGISPRALFELKQKHPFYKPDGSWAIVENPKKQMPLWSDELIKLIAFARTMTEQGVRQLTDDEALKVRSGLNENKRRNYLAYVDE